MSKDTLQQVRIVSATSLKEANTLQPKLRIRNYNTDWVFVLICLCVALFAFINTVFSKRVKQFAKAFWIGNYSSQLVKAENVLTKQASILLSVLFLMSFSLFTYQLLLFYYTPILPFIGLKLYFSIILTLLIFYTSKLILFRFVAYVFNTIDETREYSFNVFLINQTIGLFLLPIVALLNYLSVENYPFLLFFGLLIIVSFFLFRIIKGLVSLWFGGAFSKSYLFLYLCALEILPLIVLGKFIITKYQL